MSGKHAEEHEPLLDRIEDAVSDFLTTDGVEYHSDDTAPADEASAVPDGETPPEGWNPPEPPTDPDEEEKLQVAFGDPVNGVYAPHVEGVAASE